MRNAECGTAGSRETRRGPAATFERSRPPTCRRRGGLVRPMAGFNHRHGTGAKDQGVHRRRIRERAASRCPLSWQGGPRGCCCGCPASCCCDSPSGSSWRCCSNCRRVSPGWSLVPPRTTGDEYIAAALRGNGIPTSEVPAAQVPRVPASDMAQQAACAGDQCSFVDVAGEVLRLPQFQFAAETPPSTAVDADETGEDAEPEEGQPLGQGFALDPPHRLKAGGAPPSLALRSPPLGRPLAQATLRLAARPQKPAQGPRDQATKGYRDLARRAPRSLLREPGERLTRNAERQYLALLFQPPPRNTR